MSSLVGVIAAFRAWSEAHDFMPPGAAPPFRITIEAPTPEVAVGMLMTIKQEFEPGLVITHGSTLAVDLDRPMQIMGVEVKLRAPPRYADYLSRALICPPIWPLP